MQSAIVVQLKGGLGNQLFQYATARALSFRLTRPLKLDHVSGFQHDTVYRRKYLLHQFAVPQDLATRIQAFRFPGGRTARSTAALVNKALPFSTRFYIREATRDGGTSVFDARLNHNQLVMPCVFLEGYWQSPAYFGHIRDSLLGELAIQLPPPKGTTQEAEMIQRSPCAVCIGVRRFGEVPRERDSRHMKLDVDYYRAAVGRLSAQLPGAQWFVVCDDPEWVSNHLRIGVPFTLISHKPPDERAYENLWLMSLCHHFIISNSTYHWWGAWLGTHPDKIVIAPNTGFHNERPIPSGWTAL